MNRLIITKPVSYKHEHSYTLKYRRNKEATFDPYPLINTFLKQPDIDVRNMSRD